MKFRFRQLESRSGSENRNLSSRNSNPGSLRIYEIPILHKSIIENWELGIGHSTLQTGNRNPETGNCKLKTGIGYWELISECWIFISGNWWLESGNWECQYPLRKSSDSAGNYRDRKIQGQGTENWKRETENWIPKIENWNPQPGNWNW